MNVRPSRKARLSTAVYQLLILVVLAGLLAFFIHQKTSGIAQKQTLEATHWQARSIPTDLPPGQRAKLVRYGYQLITSTPVLIGPLADTEARRFAGNHLSCSNCHLKAGTQIGALPFVGVTNRYPQFRGRENQVGSIEDRINGCLERSMNGKTMPDTSEEMQAMVAYMEWLSEDVPADIQSLYNENVKIKLPVERADTFKGKLLYEVTCKSCHGAQGKGTPLAGLTFTGYLYPPLGGEDSFNDGAGMGRLITAAEFIKNNMPFGTTYEAPQLTDEEAYHIAAYITSLPRPSKANKEADFPDIALKPVSTPYGPYADSFSVDQHKYGPFQPIMDFYKERYGTIKNN